MDRWRRVGLALQLMAGARIHIGWLGMSNLARALRALARTLMDSEQTGEIVVAEEITAQAQLAYWVRSGIFAGGEGSALLCDRPELAKASVEELRALPDGSLGREFARFLDTEEISMEGLAQPTPFTSGDAESFLMQRIRQSHDLWHVLLGLGTQGHQEVLVHCFSIAQTGFPFSVFVIFFGSLKHMIFEGRWNTLVRETRRAYRHGCAAAPLLAVCWEKRWETPLAEVRREFSVVPLYAHRG
jgi:ubiquinone biosynthesis protein COQ4